MTTWAHAPSLWAVLLAEADACPSHLMKEFYIALTKLPPYEVFEKTMKRKIVYKHMKRMKRPGVHYVLRSNLRKYSGSSLTTTTVMRMEYLYTIVSLEDSEQDSADVGHAIAGRARLSNDSDVEFV